MTSRNQGSHQRFNAALRHNWEPARSAPRAMSRYRVRIHDALGAGPRRRPHPPRRGSTPGRRRGRAARTRRTGRIPGSLVPGRILPSVACHYVPSRPPLPGQGALAVPQVIWPYEPAYSLPSATAALPSAGALAHPFFVSGLMRTSYWGRRPSSRAIQREDACRRGSPRPLPPLQQPRCASNNRISRARRGLTSRDRSSPGCPRTRVGRAWRLPYPPAPPPYRRFWSPW